MCLFRPLRCNVLQHRYTQLPVTDRRNLTPAGCGLTPEPRCHARSWQEQRLWYRPWLYSRARFRLRSLNVCRDVSLRLVDFSPFRIFPYCRRMFRPHFLEASSVEAASCSGASGGTVSTYRGRLISHFHGAAIIGSERCPRDFSQPHR